MKVCFSFYVIALISAVISACATISPSNGNKVLATGNSRVVASSSSIEIDATPLMSQSVWDLIGVNNSLPDATKRREARLKVQCPPQTFLSPPCVVEVMETGYITKFVGQGGFDFVREFIVPPGTLEPFNANIHVLCEKIDQPKCRVIDPPDYPNPNGPNFYKGISSISAGTNNACVLTPKVECWPSIAPHRDNPPMTAPRMISVGYWDACAVDGDIVKCWGVDPLRKKELKLKNVREFHLNHNSKACAIDEAGLTCWSLTDSEVHNYPVDLSKHPRSLIVSSGWGYCFLDDVGVHCGDMDPNLHPDTKADLETVNQLTGVIQITGDGRSHNLCAISNDDTLKCFGQGREWSPKYWPRKVKVNGPRKVSLGFYNVCVLDNDGVKCWGDPETEVIQNVPPLTNPRDVSVGDSYACALDDNGVKCWGDLGSTDQFAVPRMLRAH